MNKKILFVAVIALVSFGMTSCGSSKSEEEVEAEINEMFDDLDEKLDAEMENAETEMEEAKEDKEAEMTDDAATSEAEVCPADCACSHCVAAKETEAESTSEM